MESLESALSLELRKAIENPILRVIVRLGCPGLIDFLACRGSFCLPFPDSVLTILDRKMSCDFL